MAEGAGGHGALICLLVASPKKQAKSAGNDFVSPRSLMKSKWTCFLVGAKRAYTLWLILVGNESILLHVSECCQAVSHYPHPLGILLLGVQMNLLKEWCNHSSM